MFLISQKLGHRAENMAALLQNNWKFAGMDKDTRNSLLNQLQPFVTASKKNKTLRFSIEHYTKILGDGIIQAFLLAEQNHQI